MIDLVATKQAFKDSARKLSPWAMSKGINPDRFKALLRGRLQQFRPEEIEALKKDGLYRELPKRTKKAA